MAITGGYITLPLLNYFIPQQGYSSTVPINQSNQLNGMEQVVIHGSQKIPHNPWFSTGPIYFWGTYRGTLPLMTWYSAQEAAARRSAPSSKMKFFEVGNNQTIHPHLFLRQPQNPMNSLIFPIQCAILAQAKSTWDRCRSFLQSDTYDTWTWRG